MSQLSIGVAGLGHGRTLLGANQPENSALPVRVTALCDKQQDKLEALGREFGIDALTSDFDELVARSDLDIIGIYTPGPLHAQQILTALDAGKHVMVTKSMVYTMEEVEQVVEAVDRSGKVLLVTQSLRGKYDFIEAKRACDAGEIGELFMAEAHYVHDLRPVYGYSPWRVEMPQDLILGGACHPIDLLRWFMGDIDEVHCYGLRSGVAPDYPQEDNFVINAKFTSGKIGRIANFLGIVHPHDVPMNSLSRLRYPWHNSQWRKKPRSNRRPALAQGHRRVFIHAGTRQRDDRHAAAHGRLCPERHEALGRRSRRGQGRRHRACVLGLR